MNVLVWAEANSRQRQQCAGRSSPLKSCTRNTMQENPAYIAAAAVVLFFVVAAWSRLVIQPVLRKYA